MKTFTQATTWQACWCNIDDAECQWEDGYRDSAMSDMAAPFGCHVPVLDEEAIAALQAQAVQEYRELYDGNDDDEDQPRLGTWHEDDTPNPDTYRQWSYRDSNDEPTVIVLVASKPQVLS